MNLALENGLTICHDFDFSTNLGNVNDQPPLVVQLCDIQHHAQMLSNFIIGNSYNFDVHNNIEFEKILERLRKMIVTNFFKHGHGTLDTFLYLICRLITSRFSM